MLVKETITNKDLLMLLDEQRPGFPKYATQLMNLANQNSQGTWPKLVGQMSDLIQEFDGKGINEWEDWYIEKKPNAIDEATDRIFAMIENFKQAIQQITRELVKEWVTDLVITKTYLGFRIQDAIIKYLAKRYNASWRLATNQEESQDIDGVVGNAFISVKPDTYKTMPQLHSDIKVHMVYYVKSKSGITIEFNENAMGESI